MAKRRLKKKVKLFISIFLFILVGTTGFILVTKTGLLDKAHISSPSQKEKPPKEVWPKVYKASLVATGDALLHNTVYLDAYNKDTDTFDFRPQLEYVKDIISNYDIAYYNQETVFGGRLTSRFPSINGYNIAGYSSYPYFNSPSEFGDAMVDAGFNTVSLASNHSADCTTETSTCIANSYKYWQSKDVVFSGFNGDDEQTNKYIIKDVNGITYTLLNYTNTLNGLNGYVSGDIIDLYDEEKVKAEIAEVRDKVDVLIVAMHWHKDSPEYQDMPTQANKNIAKFLADQGVDIVLGTYSHCLQPWEKIDDTIVFYSLGNFISNQGDIVQVYEDYKVIMGILATMDITKTVNEDGTKSIVIDNIGGDLTYNYKEGHNNYRVIPFSKMSAKYNSKYEQLYNDYSTLMKTLDNTINIVPLGSKLWHLKRKEKSFLFYITPPSMIASRIYKINTIKK